MRDVVAGEEPVAGQQSALASDGGLVLSARTDSHAIDVLYARHVRGVYSYLYAQTGTREIAEDLTSQTFVRALEGVSGIRSGESFAPWLMRIAHNTLIDHRRASHRAGRLMERLKGVFQEGTAQDDHDSLAGTESFLALTAPLPKEQRDALALRFKADLSTARVAEVLGRSEGATRMLLVRALRTLRGRTAQGEEEEERQ